MGFPKDFKFPVSRTQMYRQMGNSVAIPVVEAIAKEMVKVLNPKPIKNKSNTADDIQKELPLPSYQATV